MSFESSPVSSDASREGLLEADAAALAQVAAAPPRPLRYEVALVALLAAALLIPGLWSYSLTDPWETHYGEVARRMLQDHDWVHTQWQDEGFRSKPVLTFWLMAASMKALGVAQDGGYSGELVQSEVTMLAIRLPFALFGVLGIVLTWWILARLIGRRVAYLGALIIATCPFYALVARQGITDMTLVACMMGAVAMYLAALQLGDRPVVRGSLGLPGTRRRVTLTAWTPVLLLVGGFVLAQACYYAVYFATEPQLAPGMRFPAPAVVLPAAMALGVGALFSLRWTVRLPMLLIGVLVAAARGAIPREARGTLTQDVIDPADRHAPDRYLVRCLAWPFAWARGGSWRQAWARTAASSEPLLGLAPLRSMRQVYLAWFYAFLGLSVLGKGLPALGIFGVVGLTHVALTKQWRALARGDFELKRGVVLMALIAVPWHQAMYLKEGVAFVREYFVTHLINRAAVGVFGERGTFEFYLSQLGYGMWIWAAIVPAALAWIAVSLRTDTRQGQVRLVVVIWAMTSVAFFSLVQTKFHHYILPAVPALGLVVAFFLDDLLARRLRMHWLWAAAAVGVVLLLTRDMMFEEKQWIEMFVFRYDRPWPSIAPWSIDTSDGFLALGLTAAAALALLATRWRRLAVAAVCAAGLGAALWAMHVYMPIAGTHWGMREAIRTYYRERNLEGLHFVYFGARQLADEWRARDRRFTFEVLVPERMLEGQPLSLRLTVNQPQAPRTTEAELVLRATVVGIGEHSLTLELAPGERERLAPLIAEGSRAPRAPRYHPQRPPGPLHLVEGDRLIAWQLYWRGENFWTGDEIYGWLPEHKAAFIKTDNLAFTKYINDRVLCPLGKRYFVVTEAGRALGLRSLLPTERAKETFQIVDTTSNKFTLVAFYL